MTNSYHVATLNAYELKTGGFRGVCLVQEGKVRHASEELFTTLEAATFWAKNKAWEIFGAAGALAPVRRRGEYYANVWVRG